MVIVIIMAMIIGDCNDNCDDDGDCDENCDDDGDCDNNGDDDW